MFGKKRYPLRKCRQILKWAAKAHAKRADELSTVECDRLEGLLRDLQDAILHKDRDSANELAGRVEDFLDTHYPKSKGMLAVELLVALAVALVVAIAIRQSCFEIMSIPTGSMRPTLKEQDLLIVSKTNFGINVPLQAQHLYFDPELVERTGIVVWSGHDVDLPDTDTRYFLVIPSKKAFVKRLIGKPGDSIYFYGGRLWGVDADGNDLSELREADAMAKLEHIPFQQFEGRPLGDRSQILLRHMNQAIGRVSPGGQEGMIYDGTRWIPDDPFAQLKSHDRIRSYSDFFGLRNFAMARLATPKEVEEAGAKTTPGARLYLQLAHHPNLNSPAPRYQQGRNGAIYPVLSPQVTVLPLLDHHIEALSRGLYTARFQVSDGLAKPYDGRSPGIPLPGVPNGWYEFYYGKPVNVGFRGHSSELAADHPFNTLSDELLVSLYNYGIGFAQYYTPFRYVYFRDGDLYTMGERIMAADDQVLLDFRAHEERRRLGGGYIPFTDYGPPLKDGKVDVDFIRTFGYTVPEDRYLVLGDNHAMSADSRFCGAIPEDNLMGAPSWIVLPHDERGHLPLQPGYPWWTLPRLIVWAVLLAAFLGWWLYHRMALKRPVSMKLQARRSV